MSECEPVSVGEMIAQELRVRGWTQAVFAYVLERPAQFVSEVVTGRKLLTRESAAQVGAAFGSPAQFWLASQDAFLLHRLARDAAVQDKLAAIRARAAEFGVLE